MSAERLGPREVVFASRDAVAYLEALWTGDRERADMLWAAADEREREAMAGALASIALVALRAPESTPPGRFAGVVRSLIEDGLEDVGA